MKGVVYSPPGAGLPYIAVVLVDGEVLVSKTVSSIAAGEAMIAKVFSDFAAAKARGEI
ncbi:hypothetical protein RGV33_32905 [Pseudomonas sp. Bout1]|uniref:hypothetical protein n=1 Tax=Pseudomonas sp. Bout1 TaxID=3048600 RepID=UPI002AB3EC8A|nr:hypothetical protein [Pseudomonas sp. Bout1]MDY7536423.1 hypothetical protein [Pseudomonas sp. Bout1]MEB0187514.1 hypothetical protein [Pseudomonas sp. Bout1]